MNKKMYMLLPLLAAQAHHAQTVKDSTAAIEQVVITASRTKQKLVNVPQKLSVITASDINKTSSADVTDIIKKNTTVDVIQYPGLLSGIGIRGFRPQFSGLTQRTLLLVDGRPAGATNMGLLDQNFVERIEVLKGPASALYGSQAMGGVVNLITPKSTGPVHGKMSGSYGSFDTYTASVKAGGIDKRFDFDVSGMFFKRASNYRTGKGNVFRKILKGDQAKQVYSINRNGTIQDSLAYVNDEYGDGVTRPYTQYSYYTTSGRVGYKISSGWRVDLSSSSFVANNVESPGEITKNGTDAGLKDIYRYGGDLSITGIQGIHDLSFKAYLSSEKSNNFTVRNSKGEVIDNPFLSRITGYNWKGIQLSSRQAAKPHAFLARVSVASTASLTGLPYMVVWAGLLLHQMLLILPVLPLLVKVQVRSPSIREILILRTKTAGLRILVSNITAMSYWQISLTSGPMSKTVSLPELFRRKRLW